MQRAQWSFVHLRRDRGVALFISLVLLLVLTIVGVSAVQTTTLETRMARNEHDALLAFQAAESALRDAEVVVEGLASTVDFTEAGTDGKWKVADLGVTPRWVPEANWTGGGSVAAPSAVNGVAEPPRYMIEWVASVIREENAYQLTSDYSTSDSDSIEMFRITARGVGGTTNAVVLLQTTYGIVIE